jgi:hypothetical protein
MKKGGEGEERVESPPFLSGLLDDEVLPSLAAYLRRKSSLV